MTTKYTLDTDHYGTENAAFDSLEEAQAHLRDCGFVGVTLRETVDGQVLNEHEERVGSVETTMES